MIELPPSKEIKARIANGQIRLNDDLIDFKTFRTLKIDSAEELGNWLYLQLSKDRSGRVSKTLDMTHMLGFEPEVLADTNFPPLQKLFKGKAILKLSKKELYVIDK